jgi:hypothetical protein
VPTGPVGANLQPDVVECFGGEDPFGTARTTLFAHLSLCNVTIDRHDSAGLVRSSYRRCSR